MRRFREVWWIRHGESLGNVGARTVASSSYSLTDRGFAQAQALADWLDRAPTLIVSSSYQRSRETAEPLIARYPGCRLEEWPAHEISFLAAEKCRDTTQIERRALAEEFWNRWDPAYVDGDGAESFVEFMDRVSTANQHATDTPSGFTIVFTHAQFMRALLWRHFNPSASIDRETMQMFHQFSHGLPVPNCAIIPMLIDEQGHAFCGPVQCPIADTEDAATLDHIRLSGL